MSNTDSNTARAAAPDDPAMPESMEPAAVVPPTRRQLMMLASDMGMTSIDEAVKFARAVLARWGRPATPPALPLTAAQLRALSDVLWAAQDEGPPIEGWASQQLQELREIVDAWQAAPRGEEVGELVAKLHRLSYQNPLGTADPTITRAAALLSQLSAAAPPAPAEGEVAPTSLTQP